MSVILRQQKKSPQFCCVFCCPIFAKLKKNPQTALATFSRSDAYPCPYPDNLRIISDFFGVEASLMCILGANFLRTRLLDILVQYTDCTPRWISYIRHKDFLLLLLLLLLRPPSVTLRGSPLDSEMGWTGELWSNRVLLILEN